MLKQFKHKILAKISSKQFLTEYSRDTSQNLQPWALNSQKNLTYSDFDEMLTDVKIKSATELLRNFLISRSISIVPATASQEDIDIATEVQNMLDNMQYPIKTVLNSIYTAIWYGYSISEVIWTIKENKYIISKIKPLPIHTIANCFIYNESGELTHIKQIDQSQKGFTEIPIEKCLLYVYDELFENKKGQSILSTLYPIWQTKKRILELWTMFIQKHEGPTLAGFVENPLFKDLMREQLEAVHEGRTNITAGINDKIEIIESSHRGEGFISAINYYDSLIDHKMCLGNLLLGTGNTGSYAQSKTQEEILYLFLKGVHADIASEFNKLIQTYVSLNYTTTSYPKFHFEPFAKDTLFELITTLTPLITNMAIDTSSDWFNELIKHTVKLHGGINIDTSKKTTNTNTGSDEYTEEESESLNKSKDNIQNLLNKL